MLWEKPQERTLRKFLTRRNADFYRYCCAIHHSVSQMWPELKLNLNGLTACWPLTFDNTVTLWIKFSMADSGKQDNWCVIIQHIVKKSFLFMPQCTQGNAQSLVLEFFCLWFSKAKVLFGQLFYKSKTLA